MKIPKSILFNSPLILFLLLTLFVVLISGNTLRYPDEIDYHHLARTLQSGQGYVLESGTPTAFRPPGYPAFLSLIYRIHSSALSGKLMNVVFLGAALLFMTQLAKLGTTTLPSLLLIAYPVWIYTASTLYPQCLAVFLLLLILSLLFSPRRNWQHLCIAGLSLGVLILSAPSFMLTAPFLAWILFRNDCDNIRHRLLHVAALTACTLVVVAPWTWRNYQTFHTFIPVSTNSGINLFLGNSANAGPNTGMNVARDDHILQTQGFSEVETDHYYREQAIAWIQNHPGQALNLYARKCLNYFHFRNQLKTASQGSRLKDGIMFITWYPLLGLFILRLFFIRKHPLSPLEKAIYLLVISNVFLSAIFFTRIRFRLPFDMLMILSNSIFVGAYLQDRGFFGHNPLTKSEIDL